MANPAASINVVGIFRVPIDENELREQLRKYYFFGNVVRDSNRAVHTFVETCIPLVLFEITVDNLDERFGIGDFTQEMPEAPTKAWQRAYDEALLSADGTQVIARKSTCTRGMQSGRIAFYFHYYDPLKTMQWTYGQFSGPAVQLVPERLWNLVPYSPVD
jgi:hypothetical protein